MLATLDQLPDYLPLNPEGWKQQFAMHLNFGGGKGLCSYNIFDPAGLEMPFHRQSSSTHGSGFILPGVKEVLSWEQLMKIWPRWIARARAKVAQRSLETKEVL